jgi:hypothetical protein
MPWKIAEPRRTVRRTDVFAGARSHRGVKGPASGRYWPRAVRTPRASRCVAATVSHGLSPHSLGDVLVVWGA